MTVPLKQTDDANTDNNNNFPSDPVERLPPDVIQFCEQASLKVPFEEARKYSRANQRILEKELPALLSAYKEKKGSGDEGVEERFQERLRQVESKVRANREREVEYLRRLKQRQCYLERLLDLKSSGGGGGNIEKEWMELRLKRLVVEYKLDQGHIEEAQRLVEQLNLHDWIDIEPFQERVRILQDLANRQFGSALQWCSEYRQSLKRQRSLLEFMLRRQEMIEIAMSKPEEAIAYGRKHLYPSLESEDNKTNNDELWQMVDAAMNQIVFADPKSISDSYERTRDLFTKEFNNIYSLSDSNLLCFLVKTGLCFIKTPSCGDPSAYNLNCPACQPELYQIAASLPHAHHDTSSLVCRVTGERMDEDNPPMALPNGHVYSERGLRKYSGGEDSMVARCMCTGAEYSWDEVRKVYIT